MSMVLKRRLPALYLAALGVAAAAGCAPRSALRSCVPRWPAGVSAQAKTRGAAEMLLVADGRRIPLTLNMLQSGDGQLLIDVFGPFGAPVATMESGPQGLRLTMGRREQHIDTAARIDQWIDFFNLPITFGDLIRILSGEYTSGMALQGEPDSIVIGRRTVSGVWHIDSLRAEVTLRQRDCRMVATSLIGGQQDGWRLCFSDYRDGTARTISFRMDERNYFVLTCK